MRKRGFSIALLVLVCCFMVVFVSCNGNKEEPVHEHTYSSVWSCDGKYHWHVATCGHDVISDKAEHSGNPCTVCGYESIPVHEHSLEYRAAKPVTCTENGNFEYWECLECHKYFSDEQGEAEITDKNSVIIVAEGHTWGKWETIKQATCTEDGKRERCCSACTEIEYETIPALNHNYGNWQTVKDPTCTEEGEKQRVCSLCSLIDTETIPVIAHTYDGYINNAEYHWQKCIACQNDSEREPHKFVDGICSVCNYDNRYSFELDFKLTGDYYTVTGMGDCTDREIKIPESYEGKPVKAIAANAFWGKTEITSLNIPKSIDSIGNNAFQNCTELEKISIENKNIELGAGVFIGCEKISWAVFPAFVVSEITVTNLKDLVIIDGELENAVLTDAKNLISLTVPDISTTLGAVFGTNTNVLESLTLDETTEIAENAFKNFTALKEINLPKGINSIGADAFLNTAYYNDSSNWVFNVLYLDCYLLKANTQISGHYPINNNTTVIAAAAFNGCNGLTSITIPFVGATKDGTQNTHFGYIFGASSYSYNADYVPEGLKEVIIEGGTSIGDYAFYNCSGLTNVTIPDSVTNIGHKAFNGCSRLTSLTIPDSLTSIGDSAFYNCSSLTSITIPDSVTSIGDKAFYNCSGLTCIAIPDGVTSIGDSTFHGCGGLTSIIIPDSVTSIGSSAFCNCSSLTSITIPNDITSIGDYTFSGCSGLTSITIPDSVMSIGSYAFSSCSGLTSLTIPDSVTSIGYFVFGGCSRLTSITISASVTSIGSYAFYECSSLTSIILPDSVTNIGSSAFSGCSGLTSINIPDGVTNIGDSTFRNCSGLTSIIIPASVTNIGNRAFSGCNGLTSVTIPASVTSIGSSAFSGCSGLTYINFDAVSVKDLTSSSSVFYNAGSNSNGITVVFGDGVQKIPAYLFYVSTSSYRPNITSVTIGNEVTSIGSSAFSGCCGLTSISIPDGVASIGDSTFYNCSSLTSITIPDGVTWIGSSAFSGCSGLTSINIPDGVTSIGDSTFYNCSSLSSIIIPDSVTWIRSSAFEGCRGLTSITISDSVKIIEDKAFYNCSSLTYINFAAVSVRDLTSSSSVFYNAGSNSNGISVVFGDSVQKIPAYLFYESKSSCRPNITSVTIGNNVMSIGDYAFRNCSGLTSIIIPDSVMSIGSYAFSGCNNLTIYCEAESKLSGWDNYWNPDKLPVVWGYKNQ